MKTHNYCHLTNKPGPVSERILKEAVALQTVCPQVIIAPGDGQEQVREGIRILTYPERGLFRRIFTSFRLALEMRPRAYHIHDPELMFLGWVFRLFTSSAIIYDAHQPTFHFFLWKFGPPTLFLRFKSATLKLIEILGVIFAEGLVMGAPSSVKGIGRFNNRKLILNNYPVIPDKTCLTSDETAKTLIYLGYLERPSDQLLVLEVFFQVNLIDPDIRMVIGSEMSESARFILMNNLVDMHLDQNMVITRSGKWRDYITRNTVGLTTPNDDEFLQRSEQYEIYEFMAAGVPVICGHSPFTDDVVAEHETGIVLKKYRSLNASETVMEMFSDSKTTEFLGSNGRRLVENEYPWSKKVEELTEYYSGIFRK